MAHSNTKLDTLIHKDIDLEPFKTYKIPPDTKERYNERAIVFPP